MARLAADSTRLRMTLNGLGADIASRQLITQMGLISLRSRS
jgi:hypothetical protein